MKTRAVAIALIAFLGLVDTFYLSIKRGSAAAIPCHITRGCGDVLTSSYSEIQGIPLSTIGLIFYLFVFSCAIFEAMGSAKTLRWIMWPALAGFLISLVLVGIQAFVLKAYCEYCLVSAGLVTTIFILSFRRGQPA